MKLNTETLLKNLIIGCEGYNESSDFDTTDEIALAWRAWFEEFKKNPDRLIILTEHDFDIMLADFAVHILTDAGIQLPDDTAIKIITQLK